MIKIGDEIRSLKEDTREGISSLVKDAAIEAKEMVYSVELDVEDAIDSGEMIPKKSIKAKNVFKRMV